MAGGDVRSDLDVDGFDAARTWGEDVGLHLHGLQNREDIAFGNVCSDLGRDPHDDCLRGGDDGILTNNGARRGAFSGFAGGAQGLRSPLHCRGRGGRQQVGGQGEFRALAIEFNDDAGAFRGGRGRRSGR